MWGGSCNRSDLHTMGWSTTTLAKIDMVLGIRNLRHAKIFLMTKNMFMALNMKDRTYFYIINLKYGGLNCWNCKGVKNASSFFKTLCSAASKGKPNCSIKDCNP